MMKKYTKPEINITTLNNESVVLVSGGVNLLSTAKKYNEIDAF